MKQSIPTPACATKLLAKHTNNKSIKSFFSDPGTGHLIIIGMVICFNLLVTNVTKAQVSCNIITTVAGAGTYSGDGGPATAAKIWQPNGIATDASGNIYIADFGNSRIRKVSSSGVITTFAGNGISGFSGDGGAATAAEIDEPMSVCTDGSGNVYIADAGNGVIRKVNSAGIITTFAGNGLVGFSGDGGPATAATIEPANVLADAAGNVYIADVGNSRVRKVNSSGIITTIAGNGTAGSGGDGGPATAAELNYGWGLALDPANNLYISDMANGNIRKVTPSGTISTFAGTGARAFSGDGGLATAAAFWYPSLITTDTLGNVYVADQVNLRVRKISTSGIIMTVAGDTFTTVSATRGDGGPATAAQIEQPLGVAVDRAGNLFISSWNYIRKVNTSGIISTTAGVNPSGFAGDGGPATAAEISFNTQGIAADTSGNIYIADNANERIRKVNRSGIITTVAGNGIGSYAGDGGPATDASFLQIIGVLADNYGNIYVADEFSIRKINASGIISTFAGLGPFRSSSLVDGGAATAAMVIPYGLAIDRNNNIYLTDQSFNVVRKIDTAGIVTTIAGTGAYGYSGDGGPATSAEISWPTGITVDNYNNVYFVDNYSMIRKITPAGMITTVAGNDSSGYGGDGGPATAAIIGGALGVAVDNSGNIYIAAGERIRIVNTSGIIQTYAGTGFWGYTGFGGYSGDGGVATNAEVSVINGLAIDQNNNVYFTDVYNLRVRKVAPLTYYVGGIAGTDTLCSGITAIYIDTTAGGTWSTSVSGLATISSIGTLTAFAEGMDTVVYSVSKACGITTLREPIEIESYPALSPISGIDSICPGDTVVFTDTAGAGSWVSSNVAVATISRSGLITGLTSGTTNIQYVASNHGCTSIVSRSLFVRSSSACMAKVNSLEVTSLSLDVFPNPNKGECSVTITSPVNEQAKLEVSNMYGQKVIVQDVNTNTPVELHLNVLPGVYYIAASVGSGNWMKKIVIE